MRGAIARQQQRTGMTPGWRPGLSWLHALSLVRPPVNRGVARAPARHGSP